MKAYVLLANGFEEIEAISPIAILRRAGIEVFVLSVGKSLTVRGSHKTLITCDDFLINRLNELPDIIITPGGMPGSTNLRDNHEVQDILRRQKENGKYIASICASPIALDKCGVLKNTDYTCYPGFEKVIKNGNFTDKPVVFDNNIITARGPGVAFEFAYKIVHVLLGDSASDKIKEEMIFKKNS